MLYIGIDLGAGTKKVNSECWGVAQFGSALGLGAYPAVRKKVNIGV